MTDKMEASLLHVSSYTKEKVKATKIYLIKYLILCMIASIMCSCATTYINKNSTYYTTSVNSFGDYDLFGKTFYIESGDKNISSNDVEFREYADYVATSLEFKGANETMDKKNADMCILINYGISDESYTETVPFPIWGQTGISSINTYSNTTGSAYGSASRTGNTVYGSAYGNSSTRTTTRVNPSYGITGFAPVDRKVTQYCRIFNIYSYDNKHTSEPTMLWKTNLVSNGNSSDLRVVIPYMAFTALGFMGRNSNGTETYKTIGDDYLFLCWKQGILNQANVTVFPTVTATNVSSDIAIAIVGKTDNETIVVLMKSNCLSSYVINQNIYIEYSEKKYYVKSVDNYELGKKIRNECGTRYFCLHFPSIPSYASFISIKNDEKKGMEWNGISIKR